MIYLEAFKNDTTPPNCGTVAQYNFELPGFKLFAYHRSYAFTGNMTGPSGPFLSGLQ
jgi:hypothetical protein